MKSTASTPRLPRISTAALLLCLSSVFVGSGCATTQTTAKETPKEPKVAYEAVTPTGTNRILRQKKESQAKDPHEEAIRDRTVESWGREADRLLVEAVNAGKPQ